MTTTTSIKFTTTEAQELANMIMDYADIHSDLHRDLYDLADRILTHAGKAWRYSQKAINLMNMVRDAQDLDDTEEPTENIANTNNTEEENNMTTTKTTSTMYRKIEGNSLKGLNNGNVQINLDDRTADKFVSHYNGLMNGGELSEDDYDILIDILRKAAWLYFDEKPFQLEVDEEEMEVLSRLAVPTTNNDPEGHEPSTEGKEEDPMATTIESLKKYSEILKAGSNGNADVEKVISKVDRLIKRLESGDYCIDREGWDLIDNAEIQVALLNSTDPEGTTPSREAVGAGYSFTDNEDGTVEISCTDEHIKAMCMSLSGGHDDGYMGGNRDLWWRLKLILAEETEIHTFTLTVKELGIIATCIPDWDVDFAEDLRWVAQNVEAGDEDDDPANRWLTEGEEQDRLEREADDRICEERARIAHEWYMKTGEELEFGEAG